MRIRGRNVPLGIACSILLLTLFFTALPNWLFVDLRRVDWYWGCPLANYVVEHSIDGNSSGFMWDRLLFDVVFWIFYFSLLGLGGRMLLRKIGLIIRPGFWLVGLWTVTALLYAHLYRPDLFINAETGGFLGFLESRQWQVDMAMRFGDVEKLQTLFRKHPELVSSTDIIGRTPLHKAAYYGESSIMRLLLADGATVEAGDRDKRTPLFEAAGFTGAAELLIKSGAKVNATDDTRETPLMTAASWGNNHVVLLLLANNANVNARNHDGLSALDKAAWLDNRSTVQLLVASNADINIRDNDGETPLFYAAKDYRPNIKMVEFLLTHGADLNVVDKRGMTPLQVALECDNTNIVELLKRHGAMDSNRAKYSN